MTEVAIPWDFSTRTRVESPWNAYGLSCTVCDAEAMSHNWNFVLWAWMPVCVDHRDPRCQGCGSPPRDGGPHTSGCERCLPSKCDSCGGVNHLATNRSCACWVSVEDMPLADLKAMFARDVDSSDRPTLGI